MGSVGVYALLGPEMPPPASDSSSVSSEMVGILEEARRCWYQEPADSDAV